MSSANEIMSAMTAMASFGVAIFFLRFWRQTRDRLFVLFSVAFALMGVNWTALAALSASSDGSRHLIYVIRLAAFAVIIMAIVDKNRGSRDA